MEGKNWQLSLCRNEGCRAAAGRAAGKAATAPMSATARFSGGVAWLAAGNWTEQAINFLVFVMLARLLGAESFGLLAMASVFVLLSEFLVRESVSEVLIVVRDPTEQDYNAAFWLLLGLAGILALTLWMAAGPVAALYGEPDVAPLIRALVLTVPLIGATAVPVAILRRELRFRDLALRAVAGVVVGGAAGIGMALAGYGVWALAGQRVATVATNVALAWYAVGWRPGFRTSRAHLSHAARFGGKVLGLRAAELAATQVPSLVIGASLGAAALGLYAVAWRIVELGSFLIVTPLRVASQPTFAAMARSGGTAAVLLRQISHVTGFLAFPVFAGMAVVAQPLLGAVFGTRWNEAAPILSVLTIVGAYFCIDKVHQSFCLAAGSPGRITLLAWVTVALGVGLSILSLRWGVTGVAWAVVASYVVPWPFKVAVTARLGHLRAMDLVRPYIRPAAVTAVMALAAWSAVEWVGPDRPLTALTVGAVAGITVQGGMSLIFLRDTIRTLMAFTTRSKHPRTDKAE